jgi:hypothetical protein
MLKCPQNGSDELCGARKLKVPLSSFAASLIALLASSFKERAARAGSSG